MHCKIDIVKKITLVFAIFFALSSIKAETSKNIIPERVIFIKPENIINLDVHQQLIDEVITTFEKVDSESKIVFVNETKWLKYKYLIVDPSNREAIAKFFLQTSVTGITTAYFEDKIDKVVCKFYFFNIKKNRIKSLSYEILKSEIATGSKNLVKELENEILENFPGINIIELRKEKIKFRISTRDNPFYELFFSGGSGFCSRQSFNGTIYSSGFLVFLNVEQKVDRFNILINIKEQNFFNEGSGYNTFLYDASFKVNLSGWVVKQTFNFGAGFKINPANYYLDQRYYDRDNEKTTIRKLDTVLTFLFLNFGIRPTEDFSLSLNIGSFFCINYINEIIPFPSFPIYFDFQTRYVINKKIFFEFILPFHIVSYFDRKKNEFKPSINCNIEFGIGFYYKKDKE